MPLHVLSTVVLIIRRSNCSIQHLVSSHSVGGRPVCRLRELFQPVGMAAQGEVWILRKRQTHTFLLK